MKYYYADPLKAAWMAQEFNINFQQTYDGHKTFCDVDEADICYQIPEVSPQKNYIHPDCYEMLKPQVKDICIDIINNYCGQISYFTGDNSNTHCAALIVPIRTNGKDFYFSNPKNLKIIQRNDNAFFIPEIEM